MRLRELKELIEDANKVVKVTTTSMPNSVYEIRGLQRLINKLNELEYLGLFDHDIKRLKGLGNTIFYSKSSEDLIQLNQGSTNKVLDYVSLIKEKLTDFEKAINISLPNQDKQSISVKLPEYNQLEDLSKFFKKLDTAFHTSLTIEEVKGAYTVQNFDSGSLWVEILVTTIQESSVDKLVALKMIGSVIKTSMEYYKEFLNIQITRSTLEELRTKNDLVQHSIDELDEKIEKILQEKINKIYVSGEYSSESQASIKMSVKAFSELIGEGAEFHPAIEAPSEIVNLFPEESRKLTSPQKLLEDAPSSE